MSLSLRIFWWLNVAVAAYTLLGNAYMVAFPSQHYLQTIARLPVSFRDEAYRADLVARIVIPSIVFGSTIVFAWFAAYRQSNWARWGFALITVVREVLPWAVAIHDHYLQEFLAHQNWKGHVITVVSAVSLVLLFSKIVQKWLDKPS